MFIEIQTQINLISKLMFFLLQNGRVADVFFIFMGSMNIKKLNIERIQTTSKWHLDTKP